MAVVFGVIVVAARGVMLQVLFAAIATTPEVIEGAGEYFTARVWGAPAALCNLATMGFLLGVQEPRSCLYINIVINSVNIALDYVLAIRLGWGLTGVAYATAIAQCAGAAISALQIARLLRQERFVVRGGVAWGAVLDWAAVRKTMVVNGDIFIRTVCLLTAFAYITSQGAKLGEVVLAANSVLDQFGMLAAFFLDGFANAAEALVGEAYGAGDRATLKRHIRAACGAAAVVSIAVSALWWTTGTRIIYLLTTIEPVRVLAVQYLPYVIVAPMLAVWAFMLDGIFIGAVATGEMRNAMVAMLVLTIAVGEISIPALGNTGLWLTYMFLMAVRAMGLGCYCPRLVQRCGG